MNSLLDYPKKVVAAVLNKEPVLLVTAAVAVVIVGYRVLVNHQDLHELLTSDGLLGVFYVAGSLVMRATVWANDTHEDKVAEKSPWNGVLAAKTEPGADAHPTLDPRYPR